MNILRKEYDFISYHKGIIMNSKKIKIGYTTGVYDMFHIGHLNVLKNAKKNCDFLIVGVTTDELCYKRKNKYPIINLHDRMEIVSAIKYVDKVVIQSDMNKKNAVKKYDVDVVFVGSDWKGTDAWKKYEEEFSKLDCKVMYLDHTDGISSSILREKINNKE